MFQQHCHNFHTIVSTCICTDRRGDSLAPDQAIKDIIDLLLTTKLQKRNIYLIGNGGSAAVASHLLVDLVNGGSLRAAVLHEPSLFTCGANDYGYAHAYSQMLSKVAVEQDLLIAISSSGESQNILNAVSAAKSVGCTVITLTGFQQENAMRGQGDINIWLNSKTYGQVEVGHLFFMHAVIDQLKKKSN